ncbi:MAG: sigma-54-dependent Fis family transcriptional regulator [Deltaproteobacteria bacterium]|nr:sigma-54-dependent Fis family transcriptional regulator [Deltaproteobacteria bacterium]MBW1873000.1 sigma-54-dependent Fis family transcriptional regulator [Deltaproteobacteria bacterium]
MSAKVFVVDDQPEVIELLTELLKEHGKQARGFADGDQALAALKKNDKNVVLMVLDIDLGPNRRNGIEILKDLRVSHPNLPVVILTGKGTVDDAVMAMRLGATDFIEKDPRLGDRLSLHMKKLDRLLAVLDDNKRLKKQNALLRERFDLQMEMIGKDGGLAPIMQQITALAKIPRPVLIIGERGTGKELVAAALHAMALSRKGAFITINCAALPETLAEAELFGHEKGAYTDASSSKPGKFELADGGTLFLDEIGNMPLSIQQKILRVIEYQTFERVRGNKEIHVDVRVTAATNADLDKEMKAGRFRSDLYDRLAFDTIRVPPLRERRQDIPELCRFFVERFKCEVAGVQCNHISQAALASLSSRSFPGNVRELKNLIERAAYRCQSDTIGVKDLQSATHTSEPDLPAGGTLRERVASFEKQILEQALKIAGNNMSTAAKELGLGYDQMRRLVKKHSLEH